MTVNVSRSFLLLLLASAPLSCRQFRPAAPFDPDCEKVLSHATVEQTCGATLRPQPERRGPGQCEQEYREKDKRSTAAELTVLWENYPSIDHVRGSLGETRKPSSTGFQDVAGLGDRGVRYTFQSSYGDTNFVETLSGRWFVRLRGDQPDDGEPLCTHDELVTLAKRAVQELDAGTPVAR